MNPIHIQEEKALSRILFPKLELYWDKFQSSFQKVKKKPGPKPVHNLRVSIRRLRSILDIIQEITKGRKARSNLREIRELMRIFGTLRDLHVQYDLLKNTSARDLSFLKPYFRKLEKKISREEESLEERIYSTRISQTKSLVKKILAHKSLRLRLKKRHLLLAKKNVSRPVIRSLLQEYLLRCFAYFPLVRIERNQEDFHRLRVQVKKLRYKIEILHPVVSGNFPKAEIESLRKLQDLMGETHDRDVACHQVRQFYSRRDPSVLRGVEYRKWQCIINTKRHTLFQKSWRLLKRLEKYNFLSLH